MKEIIWGPRLKNDCRAELLEAARLLITGLVLASKLFEVTLDNEANSIIEEYQRIETMTAGEHRPIAGTGAFYADGE